MQRDQAHRTNELLERIAIALEKDVKYKVKNNQLVPDIPGFEGTLDALDNLYFTSFSNAIAIRSNNSLVLCA